MFILYLNPMRSNAENMVAVAKARTREELEAFVARERVESYSDVENEAHPEGTESNGYYRPGTWNKCFRKGGPLEWYNPPEVVWDPPAVRDVGTREDAMRRAGERFDEAMMSIPDPTL
jgi:hypothetical protein